MAQINLLKRINEWCIDKDIQVNSEDEINLDPVEMKVEDLVWPPLQQESINESQHTREVGIVPVNSFSRDNGAFGQVHTSKDTEDGVIVTILSETIKGLNRPITLSLPLDELKENFGDIQIDPSKIKSSIETKMNLSVAMEQTLGPTGATAVIRYTKKTFKAMFTCTVVLEGVVTVRKRDTSSPVDQHKLYAIVEDLKEKHKSTCFNREPDDMAALNINDEKKSKVKIQMLGEVELRWESDHSLTWQENRLVG